MEALHLTVVDLSGVNVEGVLISGSLTADGTCDNVVATVVRMDMGI